MDLRLGCSVVELVIRVRVVSGSIPGPAMYFHCLYAHPSIHTTDGAVTSQYCDWAQVDVYSKESNSNIRSTQFPHFFPRIPFSSNMVAAPESFSVS